VIFCIFQKIEPVPELRQFQTSLRLGDNSESIVSNANSHDQIIKELFRPYAPLSTFAAKIQLAYGYGLISKEDYCDIEIIRKLRNDVAHSKKHFTFESIEIKNLVLTITAAKRMICNHPEVFSILPEASKATIDQPPKDATAVKIRMLTISMALELVLMKSQIPILKETLTKTLEQRSKAKLSK